MQASLSVTLDGQHFFFNAAASRYIFLTTIFMMGCHIHYSFKNRREIISSCEKPSNLCNLNLPEQQTSIMSDQVMDPSTVAAALSSAAVLVGAYLYSSSSSTETAPNPFASDSREPSKPFENDKRKRDEVLKNGYTAKKYEQSLKDGKDYDAIIIRSGVYSNDIAPFAPHSVFTYERNIHELCK